MSSGVFRAKFGGAIASLRFTLAGVTCLLKRRWRRLKLLQRVRDGVSDGVDGGDGRACDCDCDGDDDDYACDDDYDDDDELIMMMMIIVNCRCWACNDRYAAAGCELPLVQDDDVLDTWFSSGM